MPSRSTSESFSLSCRIGVPGTSHVAGSTVRASAPRPAAPLPLSWPAPPQEVHSAPSASPERGQASTGSPVCAALGSTRASIGRPVRAGWYRVRRAAAQQLIFIYLEDARDIAAPLCSRQPWQATGVAVYIHLASSSMLVHIVRKKLGRHLRSSVRVSLKFM